MGTAAGVTNFCGLHANVHGEIRQVVHGVADDLLARIDRAGRAERAARAVRQDRGAGLRHRRLQDRRRRPAAVRRRAAAVPRAGRRRGDGRRRAACRRCWWKPSRAAAPSSAAPSSTAPATATSPPGPARPTRRATAHGNMLYPSTMFRLNGVDPQRAGRGLGGDPAADAAGRGRRAATRFPRKTPIVRPQKSGIEWRVNLTQLANRDGNAMDGTDAARAEPRPRCWAAGRSPAWPASCARCRASRTAYIVDIAPQVGIRETRRVRGALRADRVRRAGLRRASTTPSASTAGRWSCTSRATSSSAGRRSPRAAASTTCPTA